MKKFILGNLLLLTTLVCNSQTEADYNRIYNAFKNNQFNFPPPPKQLDTIYVGEWDVSQSDPDLAFQGIKGGIVDPSGSNRTVTHLPGLGYSFSYKYTLKFKVKNNNPSYPVYISINGTGYEFPADKQEAYVFINTLANNIKWKLSNGISFYADLLRIHRIPIVVTGVFRVPMMPLMVIYEPPPNTAMTNKTSYSKLNTFGSESVLTMISDKSTTRPQAEFNEVDIYKNYLKVQGMVLSNIPDPKAQIAGRILSALSSDEMWGGVTTTNTKGLIKDHMLTIKTDAWDGSSVNTSINEGGPGIGDIILGVSDARFLWVINDGKFSATMLDFREAFQYTAKDVRDSIVHGLRKDLFIALSQVDPFIFYGPTYNMNSNLSRFKFLKEYGGDLTGNSERTYEEGYTISQEDRKGETSYSIKVEDYKQGFLSYINLSPYDETETIRTEVRNSLSNQINNSTRTVASIFIQINPGEHRNYQVFFDRVYGTFALQDPLTATQMIPATPPIKGIKTKAFLRNKPRN